MITTLLDRWADRIDRWLLSIHGSEDIGQPGKSELVCLRHKPAEPWPCDDWFRANARLSARRHGPNKAVSGE